jgi:hypothetical protein
MRDAAATNRAGKGAGRCAAEPAPYDILAMRRAR